MEGAKRINIFNHIYLYKNVGVAKPIRPKKRNAVFPLTLWGKNRVGRSEVNFIFFFFFFYFISTSSEFIETFKRNYESFH